MTIQVHPVPQTWVAPLPWPTHPRRPAPPPPPSVRQVEAALPVVTAEQQDVLRQLGLTADVLAKYRGVVPPRSEVTKAEMLRALGLPATDIAHLVREKETP
jgi:hypothetical protein